MIYLLDSSPTLLEIISDISSIIIAIANLLLAYYVFYYQKVKDKSDKLESNRLSLQTLRLQWFKELIIQPHLSNIYSFYQTISTKSEVLQTRNFLPTDKATLLSDLKDEFYSFRKTFLDLLLAVDRPLQRELQKNVDDLLDKLSEAIYDEGINLSHLPTYREKIEKLIMYSKNDFIGKIFSFKG